MAIEWVIPVVKEAYAHKEAMLTNIEKLRNLLLGAQSKIAFVGRGGVGKTVLLHHITGDARKPEYSIPSRSAKEERGGIKSEGYRLAITVSPGQGGPQLDSFDNVFDPEKGVDGVVYVTDYGYTSLRDKIAIETNIKRGYEKISDWREANLAADLEELRVVLNRIRQAKRSSGGPSWLLVAANKMDLYHNDLQQAKKYYSPSGDSEFTGLITKLVEQVGTDNLEWDAAPVCAELQDFVWGTDIASTQLSDTTRNHFLQQFVRRLGELSR